MGMFKEILSAFGFTIDSGIPAPLDGGLINRTWPFSYEDKRYILQKVNDHVFKDPWLIAENIQKAGAYCLHHSRDYFFIQPVKTVEGKTMIHHPEHGYFRIFPFVKNSHTFHVVSNISIAYEAALQFGKFTNVLENFNCNQLNITLKDFHNLELRYQQFEQEIGNAGSKRKDIAGKLIEFLEKNVTIVEEYKMIMNHAGFKKRVTQSRE